MKKTIIWVALLLCLGGLMAGATVVYNNYMEKNEFNWSAGVGGMFESGTKLEENSPNETDGGEEKTEIESESEALEEDQTEAADNETSEETDAAEESETAEDEEEEEEEEEAERPYYPAPDFTVYTADGEAVKLSDFKGKTVVINFWSRNCYYCVMEMPYFQQAYEKYGDDVVFMMVSHLGFENTTVEYEKEFIDDAGYTFPVYYDVSRDAAAKYHIRGIPNTYFVQSDGGLYEYYIPGVTGYETLEECILGAMEQ